MKGYKDLFLRLENTKKIISPIVFSYLKLESKKYLEIISEYPRRMGKYLRPTLLLLSTKLYGGKLKDAYLLAATLQMSEEWLLIHDDAEDHSKERRSTPDQFKPSLNQIFGYEMAINAGDTLHTIMWKMLGDFTKQTGNWAIFDKFNEIITLTTEGQFHEINWICEQNFDISENQYFQMVDKKTGHYSIVGPMVLGSMLSKNEDTKIITNFGIPLGRAFQIKDDILNFTTESKVSGKEQFSDIKEGKRSLIFINLLQKCSFLEKEYIKSIYINRKKRNNPENIVYIVDLVKKYKCIEYAQNCAKNYIVKAKSAIKNNKKYAGKELEILNKIADFIIERQK